MLRHRHLHLLKRQSWSPTLSRTFDHRPCTVVVAPPTIINTTHHKHQLQHNQQQQYPHDLQQHQSARHISIGVDLTTHEASCCFFPKNHDVSSLQPPIFACSIPLPHLDYPRETAIAPTDLKKLWSEMIDRVRAKTNRQQQGEEEVVESVVLNIPTGFSELQRQIVLSSWRSCVGENVAISADGKNDEKIPPLTKVVVDASSAALAYAYYHPDNEGKLVTIHLDEASFSVAVAEVVYGVASIEDTDGVIHFRNYEMTEEQYVEMLTRAVIDRVKHSLKVVGATVDDVTHIILSGSMLSDDNGGGDDGDGDGDGAAAAKSIGAKKIRNQVLSLFGDGASEKVVNVDYVMATGAAVQAAILDGIVDNLILLNALPEAITVGVQGGKFVSMANKNNVYPLTHVKRFKSPEEQSHVHIKLYQGQLPIGQVTFDNVAKDTEFDITLDVDAKGDMMATIVNLVNNEAVDLPLDGSSLVSNDDAHHDCDSCIIPVRK